MKRQINKKLLAFTILILFSILIFNGSCRKDTKSPVYGKTATGSSKIVYTDVSPDDTLRELLRGTVSTYHLDLNHDGITDFDISIGMNGYHCGTEPPPYSVAVYSFVSPFGADGFGDSSLIVGLERLISPLSAGRKINQDVITWKGNGPGTLQFSSSCNNPYPSLWSGAIDKYLSLRLVVGSLVYFG